MKNLCRNFVIVLMILLGVLAAWGGALYAMANPNHVTLVGFLVVLLGYGILFGAVFLYEK